MDVKEKVARALQKPLSAALVRLEDEDGITGFVVSDRFKGKSALNRQRQIEKALDSASPALTTKEKRHVVLIAGLTTAEYDVVGANTVVSKITEASPGVIEIVVIGSWADVEYVRSAVDLLKGVKTSVPTLDTSPIGNLYTFQAWGTEANRLKKDKVVELLRQQRSVTVAEGR